MCDVAELQGVVLWSTFGAKISMSQEATLTILNRFEMYGGTIEGAIDPMDPQLKSIITLTAADSYMIWQGGLLPGTGDDEWDH